MSCGCGTFALFGGCSASPAYSLCDRLFIKPSHLPSQAVVQGRHNEKGGSVSWGSEAWAVSF
jgi:hypothetical protein